MRADGAQPRSLLAATSATAVAGVLAEAFASTPKKKPAKLSDWKSVRGLFNLAPE